MALEDEVYIYGDYDFSLESDDILDEIVSDKPIVTNKRSRPTDDTDKPVETEKAPKAPRLEEEQKRAPQKIQTTVQHAHNHSSDSRSIPSSITQLRGITTKPTNCLYLGELYWYTTDKDVKAPLVKAKLIEHMKEMAFFEHKINGKSEGIVFFEFSNKDYAMQAKSIFDETEIDHKKVYTVYTTSLNPFKYLSKESGANHKPRMNPRPMMNNGFSIPGAYNPGNFSIPSYGFPGMGNAMNRNYMAGGVYNNNGGGGGPIQSNTMMRSNNNQQQQYQPYRNNRSGGGNNMNDGAGFGGMYINPNFFDPNGNKGGGGRTYNRHNGNY